MYQLANDFHTDSAALIQGSSHLYDKTSDSSNDNIQVDSDVSNKVDTSLDSFDLHLGLGFENGDGNNEAESNGFDQSSGTGRFAQRS